MKTRSLSGIAMRFETPIRNTLNISFSDLESDYAKENAGEDFVADRKLGKRDFWSRR